MPVFPIPLIGPNYVSREKPLSAQKAINMWPEINPEARNQVCLHNVAGKRVFAQPGGADRGMHDFNNLMYVISGQTLYAVDAEGAHVSRGTIPGNGRCVMANDGYQIIIVTGSTPYRYTVADGVEAITDPDLVNPTTVAYINSQFLLDNNNGIWGEFVTSSIETGFAIDSLDFAVAESHPDDLTAIIAFRQLAYMFGSRSVEPWANTGTGNPPWARASSGVRPFGLAGRDAVLTTTEYIYFLDHDRIPRRSNGLDFPSISNPALGVEFAKYSKIDDCIAFEFIQDAQQFVAFTFPTENRTWCFHEQSGSWFQLSHGINGDRDRASSMLNIYGLNYCADHSNGNIYEYSLDIYTDNGEHIIKQRDTAMLHGGLFQQEGKEMFIEEVEFIIVAGQTEVAGTGLGPQPIIDTRALCGTSDDLTQGQLLNVGAISQVDRVNASIAQTDPLVNSVNLDNTQVISFTCAFMRENSPDPTYTIHAIDLYNSDSLRSNFAFYMDENGYMNITAENSTPAEILNVQITNDGGSFADSALHFFAVVIDLSDTAKREIYHNATNIGASSWVTWNTYTDDTMQLADQGAGSDNHLAYYFGRSGLSGNAWGEVNPDTNGTGGANGIDAVGYCSFDDDCSLLPPAVWDSQGYVRDPQAWEGWYMVQPHIFYGPSFWKNSGTSAPASYGANDMEKGFEQSGTDDYVSATNAHLQVAASVINAGIGGITAAVGGSDSLPPAPPADPQTEIVAPFWENTGNWIDLSALTQTTYETLFGYPVEGADFNEVYVVDQAALVNTSDAGNRIQIQDTGDCTNAALYICDASGNVVDSMIYANGPNGDSVLIPTGANYYVVLFSDTSSAKVKKWDSSSISLVGSTPWQSFFGTPFELPGFWDNTKAIALSGISLAFTVPITSTAYKLTFATIENTTVESTRTGSVGQTVGDYTSAPTETWGIGNNIDCGINNGAQDIELLPGETYFFCVRNNDPYSANNLIRIQAVATAI